MRSQKGGFTSVGVEVEWSNCGRALKWEQRAPGSAPYDLKLAVIGASDLIHGNLNGEVLFERIGQREPADF
ncbi:hypothetical protein PAMC26510_03925 [Caballeronia sordidicola]|uniref:Uncharacterized protein n=1 Tax=Caballeronia sordidicola TaxID=196367 RepID=A0A242N8Z7_CABSO|nr:hypothetical protein PAMC26510_03925 [Caballeronia sordidicola]